MSNCFPCPNPVCTHVFGLQDVKGASSLRCPRCGHSFTFQAKPASPPTSTAPRQEAKPRTASPETGPVTQPPLAIPVPIATPVGPLTQSAPPSRRAETFDSVTAPDWDHAPAIVESPIKRNKRTRRTRDGLFRLILFTFLGGFIAAVAYMLVFVLPQFGGSEDERRKVQLNFSFSTSWAYRDDLRLRRLMDCLLGMSRSNPRGHFVLHVIDYKTREPSPEELLDEAIKRLKAGFPRLQYKNPLSEGKTGELDNEPAYQFDFRGTAADEVPMIGQCSFLTRRGYGYWLICWGPAEEEDELEERFQRLRSGFRFANGREGWQPSPRPTTQLVLGDQAFQLNYVQDLWRVEENPTDYDPRAVVVLRGFEMQGERSSRTPVDTYAGKSATVQLLLLDRTEDLATAVEQAKAHLTNQLSKVNAGVKLEPYVPEGGQAAIFSEVGAFKGDLRFYEIRVGNEAVRFALLGVVNRPEAMLVIFGECPLEKRGYWMTEFKALVETVRPSLR